jgi:hypothetical protein
MRKGLAALSPGPLREKKSWIRTSLDILAMALLRRHRLTIPENRVYFPIADSEEAFLKKGGAPLLQQLPTDDRAKLLLAQALSRGQCRALGAAPPRHAGAHHNPQDSPMLPPGTTVTFDTNTLDKAARPERHPKDPARADFQKVHEALKTGRLRGYFSQTLVTLEGIEKKDRPEVFGSTRLETQRPLQAKTRSTSPLRSSRIENRAIGSCREEFRRRNR